MGSPERKISVVPPAGTEAGVEARLASLEGEAERLRAEVATLQDEIRWLTDEEAEWSGEPALISRGWLARGWVRASLLLAAVGFVALVSVPYLFHLLDPSGRPADPAPVAAASSVATVERAAPTAAPAPAAPAVSHVPQPERVPAPVRVRASEIPDPTRVLSEYPSRRPGRAAGLSERGGAIDAGPSSAAPVRSESP
ncbi:MAG TPA: hypothetical protein VIG07_17830 [Methylomirabilota bacterium]|jgi:hypothetical protein